MNFFHTQKHNDTAYEFFYKNGPLAILPMQSENSNFQSSIIWSNDKKYLSSLVVQNDKMIKEILEEKIGDVVGKIKKIGAIFSSFDYFSFFAVSFFLNNELSRQ